MKINKIEKYNFFTQAGKVNLWSVKLSDMKMTALIQID